jgi:hypothetical protein
MKMEKIVKDLYDALVEKYKLMGTGRSPEIAASFAVENYLSMYRHCADKEIYLAQELEDVLLANEKRRA